ncbi:MFS general substrate transporter [Eremomyces bilateralis CBS 781.70]|uniref:MFS general substrate transporter n=1 Tax=Eremomyces bilateralis CBS 781.70 TaxID=1392243 RepID=A0A6G1FSJ3_9PEZI|nr:MFS general substrate transporter [Eremomyces bilateralis CBS 781.70]KAF1808706.1 MFS general substrate transporter [Eremomyces bilateralis CBS 781.70]
MSSARLVFWRPESPATSSEKGHQPFPWRQLGVLALCRLCEPIAFMSIFPYIFFMVKWFSITENENEIATYTGLVTAAFAFAEFVAAMVWGRMSDRIGRKPVLLMGMFGTGLSMLLFGLAPSIWVALVARILGGLLNGNIGVIQTTVSEIVTAPEHIALGYSIMPSVWCIGSIIGGIIGGSLADPGKNHPSWFSADSIFVRFPYLLPNVFCTGVVLFSLSVGFLFLEETHEEKRHGRDRGVECGDALLRCFGQGREIRLNEEETMRFLQDGAPACPSTDSLPTLISLPSSPSGRTSPENCEPLRPKTPPLLRALTKQVLLNIAAIFILAFHTICFEQLLPVLFAEQPSRTTPQLPFKFDTGFGLSETSIGWIVSAQGVLQIIAQLVAYPRLSNRFGCLRVFQGAVFSYPILYFGIPYLALLPSFLHGPGILLVLVWKVCAQACTFPSLNVMLSETGDRRLRGTLLGISMSAASLSRGIGPIVSGVVHSAGSRLGYSGLAWWLLAFISICGGVETLWMRRTKASTVMDRPMEEDPDIERPLSAPFLGSHSSISRSSHRVSPEKDDGPR